MPSNGDPDIMVMKSSSVPSLALATLLIPLLSSCTLLLDWDPNEKPCDSQRRCLDGYSCLGTYCIADDSVAEGETCNQDAQCADDLACSPGPFVCRKPCSRYFEFTQNCDAGEFCMPYPTTDANGAPKIGGACYASQCTSTAQCDSGEVCVKIHSSASACIPGCELRWTASSLYADSCEPEPGKPQYCQPIGAQGGDMLVCLETSDTAQGVGDICSPVSQPCLPGLACISGVCKQHCNLSGGEPCPGSCVKQQTSTAEYGICP